jgi:hypothetical protein
MNTISEYILRKKSATVKRAKAFHNFSSAKVVGIIFNAADENSFLSSIDFIKYLQNQEIKVKAIGFVKNKEKSAHFPYFKGVKFAAYSEISLWKTIKNDEVNRFVNTNFDILIDISQKDNFAIKSIIALSKSKMRISRFMEDYLYDIQLKIGQDKPVDFVTKQIVYYLGNIQSAV